MTSSRALVFIGAIVGMSLSSGIARAEAYIAPCRIGSVWPTSGEIPRDQPAFVVDGHGTFSEEPEVVLEQTDGEGVVSVIPVTVTRSLGTREGLLVVPAEPLVPGTSVELRGDICREVEGYGSFSVIYRVVDTMAELPAPPLTLSSRVRGRTSNGYFDGFFVEVAMDVEGGGELRAWWPIVVVVLGIGDSEGPSGLDGARRARRGFDLACEGFEGLAPGAYTLRGSLASDGTSLGSTEQETVIACEDAVFYDTSTDDELTPAEVSRLRHRPEPRDAGSSFDGGPGDAGPTDASSRWDASPVDAGTEDSGSGGCSTGAGGMNGVGWVIGFVVVRNRSRRARWTCRTSSTARCGGLARRNTL